MGEISEIKTGPFGSILHADDYVSEGVPIITTEHFKTGSLPQNASGLPQVSEVDYKRLSAYTLNNGDIVFSRVGSVDINALVTPFQRNWLFSGRVLRVRPEIDVLPQFLHTRLETESIKNDICARAVGQTMPSINTEILKATQLVLPTSMAEQKQIGLYFAKLDHLITLHQRKYDKLQVLKKAMLEKMFPKNGSSVPEIRFKGFTDAWEQRKLGEISEIKTGPFGSILHADDYVSEGVPIITTEHFKTGSLPQNASGLPQVSEVDYKRLSAYTLNNGDIVFSRVGSVDINALVTPFQRNWLFSGRVLRVRPEIDVLPQFLHTRLETESIKNDICARAVGQTMPSINTEILKATQLVLPTSMAEQKQIGLYFAKLDHLITLHQRELEKLQNIKKSMLEKMFV